MRKNHVVRKQGYFKVDVAQNWTFPSRYRYFHSYELASRYLRYHVSYLGWNYGYLYFIDYSDKPFRVLFAVDREA